jgi:stringent starvation protein B
MNALDASSTRPYLIRALYEWCTDNALTPYVAVLVDDSVQVPREYVKNNEIVLNISFDATSSLKLGNDFIEFKARFAGSAREIIVPVSRVIAIYARENGQGMAFPAPVVSTAGPLSSAATPPAIESASPAIGPSGDGKVVRIMGEGSEGSEKPVPGVSHDEKMEPPEPQPPKSPQGARPSLKRVK